ncbi:MAG: DUF5615 family PIN-like protein [Lewinellaceae bacterium]|nr:DUF5615 family PIN-like protein [Lewinellaceae bacterium]
MKFLLDVGISPRLGRLLEEAGHTFRFTPDHYSNRLTDAEILEVALRSEEVIIAHDLDFGTQLAFSGATAPSVIIFRIHHINPELFFQLLMTCWEGIEVPLNEGALVLIDQTSVRIRYLPIR